MDSLTHIVLGACIGEALLGRELGKRALFIGAVAQSIPDIDFISSFWSDTATYLLAHRGFTHSLLFDFLAAVTCALFMEHFHKTHGIGFNKWILFFGLQISTHLFLDLLNAYGTGLFEPFSHARLSFHVLFVADPFFSVWPAVSLVMLLILKPGSGRRRYWWRFALLCSSAYLFYCTLNKFKIEHDVKRVLATRQISHQDYFTTPTPLNNWLWYTVVKSDSGFYIGFRSVFDTSLRTGLRFFPKNDSLLRPVSDHEELQHLVRFSQGYYTVEKWNDTLVFNDLRFGQIAGWHHPEGRFVFYYFLEHPENDNKLVVQRGRFAGWNLQTTKSLLKRIAGN